MYQRSIALAGFFIFKSSLCLFAFEGCITAELTQGGQETSLLYTVCTDRLRLEVTASSRPDPVNVLDVNAGTLTLLFPHNRSFVRLKTPLESASPAAKPGSPPLGSPTDSEPPPLIGIGRAGLPTGTSPSQRPTKPQLPPGVGPQAGLAPSTLPHAGGMLPFPAMPMMPEEPLELKATGEKTNLFGLACERFELKRYGEVMEIWATDKLSPFQNYLRNQPSRLGPRRIEEQWGENLQARNLFPLRASLRFEGGGERLRFEVQSIAPQPLKPEDAALFVPPTGYQEIEPLPF